jgi:hypothetical protein
VEENVVVLENGMLVLQTQKSVSGSWKGVAAVVGFPWQGWQLLAGILPSSDKNPDTSSAPSRSPTTTGSEQDVWYMMH